MGEVWDRLVPPGFRRAVCKGRERHRVYKEQQDLSGVLKTDSPLGGNKDRGGGEETEKKR